MAINTKQASSLWGISDRRIRLLCSEGKIKGAELIGKNGIYQITLLKQLMEELNFLIRIYLK